MRPLAGLAALLLLALAPAARADELADRLVGTWHVLVHYQDKGSEKPDQKRWDDRVWVFEKTGDRLRWVEYPIVVFTDESGRFERRDSGQLARVLGYWEPNEAQVLQIREGVELNSRGMKSKTLRRTQGAWRSASRPSAASASIVSYTENWSIEGSPELPVFRREDQLGGEATDTLDGVTLYTTTRAEAGGDLLHGSYERDGTRSGSFRMTRAGAGKALSTKRTQAQRERDAFLETIRRRRIDPAQLTEQDRADMRAMIGAAIQERMGKLGLDPAQRAGEMAELTSSIESKLIAERLTLGDIPRLVEEAVVAP